MAVAQVLDRIVSMHSFVVGGIVMSSARPRDKPTLHCRFEISVDEFVAILSEPYDRLVVDLREDDAITGDTDFLSTAGYPPLQTMLGNPTLLLNVFESYLAIDFFSHFLSGPGSMSNVRYFIDHFSALQVEEDRIIVDADCLAY